MKFALISVLLFGSSLSVHAATTIPSQMVCTKVSCSEVSRPVGSGRWCDDDSLNRVDLLNLNTDAPVWSKSGTNTPGFFFNSDPETGKDLTDMMNLNFSDDSDQYAYFSFAKSDLEALAKGKAMTILATFTDGFDWSNGFNIRERTTLSCSLK